MARSISIFNKGSIVPSIIELETELIERETEASRLAEEKIHKAKITSAKLIDETTKELLSIEENERKTLLEEVDARVEELKIKEERDLLVLEQSIQQNRKRALDFILHMVIPQWDGQYPD